MAQSLDPAIKSEKEIITKNGIPVYYYGNEHLHSFCICLYVKAGSMYEKEEQNGMTHFFEHLLFRKLNLLYDGKLYHLLDRLGLELSACTYKEFMTVSIKGAVKHFTEAADIISRVFEPISLSAKEIDLERKRVKAEIREHNDKTSLDYFTQTIVWNGTPLQNTILGKAKVLDKIGPKSLQKIQDEILSEGNLFFYVTGCFEQDDLNGFKEKINDYKLSVDQPKRENMAPLPKNFFHRTEPVFIKNNNNYHYLRFSFDVDVSRHTYAELDLLYDILFSGEMSKLFQELSEKNGYIYSYNAKLERYANLCNLYFSFEIDKKNILPAMEKVIEVLQDVKKNITDELQYVLPTYTDNAWMMLDDDETLNWNMAYECHIMNCNYKNVGEMKEAYEKVTAGRIMEIAQEIFRPGNMTVTMKTRKKDFSMEKAKEILCRL